MHIHPPLSFLSIASNGGLFQGRPACVYGPSRDYEEAEVNFVCHEFLGFVKADLIRVHVVFSRELTVILRYTRILSKATIVHLIPASAASAFPWNLTPYYVEHAFNRAILASSVVSSAVPRNSKDLFLFYRATCSISSVGRLHKTPAAHATSTFRRPTYPLF